MCAKVEQLSALALDAIYFTFKIAPPTTSVEYSRNSQFHVNTWRRFVFYSNEIFIKPSDVPYFRLLDEENSE